MDDFLSEANTSPHPSTECVTAWPCMVAMDLPFFSPPWLADTDCFTLSLPSCPLLSWHLSPLLPSSFPILPKCLTQIESPPHSPPLLNPVYLLTLSSPPCHSHPHTIPLPFPSSSSLQSSASSSPPLLPFPECVTEITSSSYSPPPLPLWLLPRHLRKVGLWQDEWR